MSDYLFDRAVPGNRNPAAGETVNALFQDSTERFPDRPALSHKVHGAYEPITYADLMTEVRILASALINLGVQRGDRIAIIGINSVQWVKADLAVLAIGAVTVPVYPSLPANQVAYALADCGAVLAFAGDALQSAKLAKARVVASSCRYIVAFEGEPDANTVPIEDLMTRGRADPLDDETWHERWSSVQAQDLASIIYTSGTTGEPKGVELTHANFVSVVNAGRDMLPWNEEDVFLSFLPLAHIYERTVGYYLPLSLGACIAYVEGLARLPQNFTEARPTYLFGVPRLYEMMRSRVESGIEKESAQVRRLFHWAMNIGEEYSVELMHGRIPSPMLAKKRAVADAFVLKSVRDRFGGRLKYMVSGGAALSADTLRFFHALGMPILEGYGLTETTSLLTVSRPGAIRPGSIGLPAQGFEVRLAEDGELECRGGGVARGYWNRPEATAEAFTPDGWFKTGDLASFIDEKFVVITDRKKDIIVLSNGKNIAPQLIEGVLKESPYITDVALMGDRGQGVVALIVPAFERLQAEHGAPQDRAELAADPEVRKIIKAEIDKHSKQFADFERIRRFAILPNEFSIDSGELTPTLKVKRHVIAEKYADVLAGLLRD